MFSSPSWGSYISTIIKIHFRSHNQKVLVPFPGFLYLYIDMTNAEKMECKVLVPFPGFLYLYPVLAIP